MRSSSFFKTIVILGIFIVIVSFSYWGRLATVPANFIHRKPLPSEDFQFDNPTGQNWTYRIWQTSRNPLVDISDEEKEHVKTWSDLNPEYRLEVLTDEMMESYVKEHFHTSHPDFEEIYFEVKDYILRSDLIRYLILLVDGGVYNDLDVGCEKPIRTWVPPQYKDSAGIVLGVEVDNKFGPDGRTFEGGSDLFQLVNWTIMSKPNQPFMWFLVERVMDNIRKLATKLDRPISKLKYSIQEVLDLTGPAALTRAFFDYATDITSSNVTHHNFTKMTKPRLIGEVVILPIQAFGAGHQVKWAGMEDADGSELIHHYFAGSWKTDHVDEPPQVQPVDEEQKDEEEEGEGDADKAKEEEKKVAEAAKLEQEAIDKAAQQKEEQRKEKDEEGKAEKDDNQNDGDSSSTSDDVNPESSTSTATTNAETSPSPIESTTETATSGQSKPEEEVTDSDSDKPASVKYMEAQPASENPSASNTPEIESVKVKIAENEAAAAAEESQITTTEDDTAKKEEEEAEAEAERQKHEAAAEAKIKALKAEQAAKLAEERGKAQKPKTQEEIEEEERKKAFEKIKAAAPKWAPKKDGGELQASNNLADYDYQPD